MKSEESPYKKKHEMNTGVIHIYGIEDMDIICPHCWKIGKMSVPNIPMLGKRYKMKCKCGQTFLITFDKRRNPRYNTKLSGVIRLNNNEHFVEITDLSIGGCSFLLVDSRCKPTLGDKLLIRFKLSSPKVNLIECTAIVRYFGERVGVEFIDITDQVRKTLDRYFYFLNS